MPAVQAQALETAGFVAWHWWLPCCYHSNMSPSWPLQIGFVAKGVVYAIIGGLACQSGAQDESEIRGADISPQVGACRKCWEIWMQLCALHCTARL